MEAIETFSENGFTASLYYEEDPPNPRENDNLGKMVCWHRRYNLGDEQIKPSNFEIMAELETSFNARLCLALYLYDHGGITMRTSSFGDPWDSGQVGFIYVTAEAIRKEYGVKRITKKVEARARSVLEGEVEEYDQYLTGDVYGYVIKDEAGKHVDSCWGFFELKYAREEAQAALAAASKDGASSQERR